MGWLLDLRLIKFFSFYLALIFLLGSGLRLKQYGTVLSFLFRLKSRWPNLTKLVLAHRNIFLSWGTVRPLVIVLLLFLANTLAATLVWPEANEFRVRDLVAIWPAIPLVAAAGAAMIGFDLYGTLRVESFDHAETERYFDQAEFWLQSWKAPVVRILSFGYVNPRQMVAHEVRTALEDATQWLNSALWWVSTQAVLRILDFSGVVQLARRDAKFAQNDLVLRLGVAAHQNLADMKRPAFADVVDEIDLG